jgi:hypothetical protein
MEGCNMKKPFLFALIVLLFLSCEASIEEQKQVFNLPLNLGPDAFSKTFIDVLGVTENYKVKFYENESESEWKEHPELELALPKNYISIFSTDANIIGVVANNKIKFYEFDGRWKELPRMRMRLPKNFDSVHAESLGEIKIVQGNKVITYVTASTRDVNWQERPKSEMTVPEGTKYIFGFSGYGFYIVDNTNEVKRYKYERENGFICGFTEEPGRRKLILPDEYTGVFNVSGGIRAVVGDKVKYYSQNNDWAEIR